MRQGIYQAWACSLFRQNYEKIMENFLLQQQRTSPFSGNERPQGTFHRHYY
jgi:hypothetical protein